MTPIRANVLASSVLWGVLIVMLALCAVASGCSKRERTAPVPPVPALPAEVPVTALNAEAPNAAPTTRPAKPASAPASKAGAVAAAKATGGCGSSDNRYSPFVIELENASFDVVSFKDVGLLQSGPAQEDPLLETIAESLAQAMREDAGLGYQPTVSYSTTAMDPESHCACEGAHLYVDVWRKETPATWGYSLWSGCGEEDRFAWSEVGAPEAMSDDLVRSVEPLTRSIVEALGEAQRKGCYQRSC